MHSTAAISEKRSTHCEMLVMGSRAGAGGRPDSVGGASSVVMSAISTNSRSRIRFTSLVGRDAMGLNGPGVWKGGLGGSGGRELEMFPVDTLDAAAASRSSPELPIVDGVNMGRDGRVATAVVVEEV